MLFGVIRLSLSEPGLGPLAALVFSAVAAAARGVAAEQPQRLLVLKRALLTLPAVSEAALLRKSCGHLHTICSGMIKRLCSHMQHR